MPKKALLVIIAAVAVMALGVQPTRALTISLDTPNAGISAYPSPYGSVELTLSGQTATFTFTAANPDGMYAYLFGNGGIFGVNLNTDGNFTYTSPVGSGQPQVGPEPPQFKKDFGQNLDGFGTFNFSFDNIDGFKNAVQVITFTVTNTSEDIEWLSDVDVLWPNSNGATVGAHIFVAYDEDEDGNELDYWTNTKNTGYAAGDGDDIKVPDGGMTISLLGLALAGMGLLARFRK